MNKYAIVLLLFIAGCGAEQAPVADSPSLNVDAAQITVSGVSSGAMMATQMHLALSDLVGGVAMVSAGPYYCAEGSLKKGLGPCMKGGDTDLPALLDYARVKSDEGSIGKLANLSDDPVWIFRGSRDVVMHADLTKAAQDFYIEIGALPPIVVDDIDAPHGFPTMDAGAPCDAMAEPFLNACAYDTAGEILRALHGDLHARTAATESLIEIPQPGADDATMLPAALAYVPETCSDGSACAVHIAFHGCQQSTAFVGDAFAKHAGYNEWAESNDLIILYPQVDSSKIAPMNPMGCWDWWGYTDENYATNDGAQIRVVAATLELLAGKEL